MRTSTHVSKRRASTLLSVSALAATALISTAGTAGAAITQGPGGIGADGIATMLKDAQGVAVQQCLDGVNCAPPAAGDGPMYFSAEATAGSLRASWVLEGIFLEDAAGNPTDQLVISNSAIFRAGGLLPNRRYTIKGPWGSHTCLSDGRGDLDNKNCLFEGGGEAGGTIASGPVKTLLRQVNAPAGFLGSLEAPARVTGSPSGFNRVTLSGPGVGSVGTSQFIVNGQMPANTAMTSMATTAVNLGNVRKATPTVRNIGVSSFGTANATVNWAKSGANPGAFAVTDNCASVASGAACNIRVTYTPRANRDASAILTVTDNSLAAPRQIVLNGTAQDTRAPKIASKTPARGAQVGIRKNVSVKFSEAVRGIRGNLVLVSNSTGRQVGAKVSRVGKTNRYVLNPRRSLARGSSYTVRVNGGRLAVRDLAGNAARDVQWKFRTR